MVQRLLWRELLFRKSKGEPARACCRQDAGVARRSVGWRRRQMPGGVSVQGVSSLLGCLFRRGQLRFSASAKGGKCWKCCLQQKARGRRGEGETRIED